ncbi:MAG: hypothetical protein Q7S31_00110 [bacterium]|nr:hypothetical protein [bacterium]
MTKMSSLFLFWVTLLAIFISLTSLTTKAALPGQVFQILFLPIPVYLVYTLVSHWSNHASLFDSQSGWRKIIVYYCFIVSLTLVIASFISAKTISQIISSLVFSPLAIYFFWLALPRYQQALPLAQIPKKKAAIVEPVPPVNASLDGERRDFLKLIGTAGVSIFLYNLLFRRDAAPLFGSSSASTTPLALQNAQGEVINPAERSPTQGYYISQIDDSTVSYFGFINNLGQWFIMRQDTDNSYRYTRGDKNFTTNWAKRIKLTYDSFDNVF